MTYTLALPLALIILAALAFVAFLFARAPEGWEDSSGFHLGPTPDETRGDGADGLGGRAVHGEIK